MKRFKEIIRKIVILAKKQANGSFKEMQNYMKAV